MSSKHFVNFLQRYYGSNNAGSSFRNTWDVRHEEKDFIRHKANMTVKGRSFVEYGRLFKVLKRQSPETKTPKFRGLKLSES